jgi:hypothetical protein
MLHPEKTKIVYCKDANRRGDFSNQSESASPQIQRSSLTGSYVMETAEHRESRGSGTVLGAPGGEIPPGDSTFAPFSRCPR